MKMTSELEAKLRQIGWFPQRSVGDDQITEWLRMGVQAVGCHVFPEVIRVLREYGGLTFGSLHFSPEGSHTYSGKEEWLYWEWKLNEVLFPIAYDLGDAFTYALSSTGKVYGTGVSNIFCGDSFEEFLSNQLAFDEGKIKWIDQTPVHWTTAMDAELDLVYKSVYTDDSIN